MKYDTLRVKCDTVVKCEIKTNFLLAEDIDAFWPPLLFAWVASKFLNIWLEELITAEKMASVIFAEIFGG